MNLKLSILGAKAPRPIGEPNAYAVEGCCAWTHGNVLFKDWRCCGHPAVSAIGERVNARFDGRFCAFHAALVMPRRRASGYYG